MVFQNGLPRGTGIFKNGGETGDMEVIELSEFLSRKTENRAEKVLGARNKSPEKNVLVFRPRARSPDEQLLFLRSFLKSWLRPFSYFWRLDFLRQYFVDLISPWGKNQGERSRHAFGGFPNVSSPWENEDKMSTVPEIRTGQRFQSSKEVNTILI